MNNNLSNAINAVESINYTLVSEKNPNEVLQIFVKVNSGGQKLSASDLLMSVITEKLKSDNKNKLKKPVYDWLLNGAASRN